METWKPVVGYEGLYEVSDMGRVKTLHYKGGKEERILCEKKHLDGYLFVELYKNGSKKPITIHRLVATAFIENPNNFPCINHKDENKANNKAENLEWCTWKYNVNYSIARRKERNPQIRFTRNGRKRFRRIVQVDLDGNIVKTWQDSRTIFLETNMSDWAISQCCVGKQKTAYGYKWHYAAEYSGRESAL